MIIGNKKDLDADNYIASKSYYMCEKRYIAVSVKLE